MKKLVSFLVLFLFCCRVVHGTPGPGNNRQPELTSYRAFKENKGQVTDQFGNPRSDIHFQLNNNNTSVFIGRGRIHYQWNHIEKESTEQADSLTGKLPAVKIHTYRLDMELAGFNADAVMIKEDVLPDVDIYYAQGLDGARVHSYQKVTYRNIYPGIDWILYIKGNSLKYDFVVHPGGKVSDIQIRYNGATSLAIQDGLLIAATPMGNLTEQKPYSYIAEDGRAIASRFTLNGNVVGFEADKQEGTLVIDPELRLEWGTYYGGSGDESGQYGWHTFYGYSSYGNIVTTDFKGDVYLSGTTMSIDNIATTGAFQTTLSNSGNNAFLAKFDAEGQRIWATYFGGTGGYVNPDYNYHEGTVAGRGHSVACDTLGNIYMTGITWSDAGIATPGAYQSALNGVNSWPDLYLLKLHSNGDREWSTYFGNIMNDEGGSLAVTPDGSRIYLAGASRAGGATDTVATPGALFPAQPAQWSHFTGFLTCFNAQGQKKWGTYIANVVEITCTVYDITLDNAGDIFLTGYMVPSFYDTNSIATQGTYQTQYSGGLTDGFLQKWDSTGNRIWGTYYGGSQHDCGFAVACDENDHVYISGGTESITGPVTGLWSIASQGSYIDANTIGSTSFLAKFNSATGQRVWGTYFGGSFGLRSQASSLACRDNRLFMLGNTSTPGLATPCANNTDNSSIYTNTPGASAFLALFSLDGQPEYLTYHGGKFLDYGTSVTTAKSKEGVAIYFSGNTYSPTNITTSGSYKSILGSQLSVQRDAFLVKFFMPSPQEIIVPCFTLDSVQLKAYDTLAGNYQWSNGATGYSIWVQTSGTYFVHYDKENGCPGTDTFLVSIYPMPLLTTQKACMGAGGATVAVQEGNRNNYNYKWSKATGELIADRPGNTGDSLSGLQSDSYMLQITAAHCDTTLFFTIEAFPEVALTAGNDTLVAAGSSVQLWASGAVQYKWEPEQWLDNPGSARPFARPEAPVTYTVTGYNQYGCKASREVHIDINDRLFIPNAFSPNGDGLNDEFKIGNYGYYKLAEFLVFNRWGEAVFSTTNPAQGWKGNHKGKPADSDVYHYYISLFNSRGDEQVFKGDITLIR